jgi:hypothetical protein
MTEDATCVEKTNGKSALTESGSSCTPESQNLIGIKSVIDPSNQAYIHIGACIAQKVIIDPDDHEFNGVQDFLIPT